MEDMNISRMTAAMYRTGQSILAQRLQPLELNGGQMDCLFVITLREGLSQMELAQLLFAGKSVTAKWVKVLIEKGYVYIAESPLYEITCKDKTWFAYSEKEKGDILSKLPHKRRSYLSDNFAP